MVRKCLWIYTKVLNTVLFHYSNSFINKNCNSWRKENVFINSQTITSLLLWLTFCPDYPNKLTDKNSQRHTYQLELITAMKDGDKTIYNLIDFFLNSEQTHATSDKDTEYFYNTCCHLTIKMNMKYFIGQKNTF